MRVRVRAVSLNYRDLMWRADSKKRAKRIVPASDGAGEVVEIGSDVKRFATGDRVAAAFFPTWLDGSLAEEHHANALGGSLDGMLAEEVVLPERAWVKIPSRYSFEQASTLPCAGVTAWHALFEAATLRPGETVLVQGGGGVSTFALQLARYGGCRGHRHIELADKRARLAQMGATSTIDYTNGREMGPTRREPPPGQGGQSRRRSGRSRHLRSEHRVAALRRRDEPVGDLAGTQGPINTYASSQNIRIAAYMSVGRDVRAAGARHGTVERRSVIDSRLSFEETRAAYEHLASGAHFGKVVISVPLTRPAGV